MGGLLFPNQSHCYCFVFFATVVFSRNNCPARGQPETTKSSSKCEITLVISEHVYTALFSITKKKIKKKGKERKGEKKTQKQTKTCWRPWLCVALGTYSVWLPAQFLAPLFLPNEREMSFVPTMSERQLR